jgi:predicted SnoaL-like aldol condensation-catalyzing enzyme
LASLWVLAFALAVSTQPACANEELTARNKEVVRNFYSTVLIGRDVDAASRFLRPDYIQHNPQVPTGLKVSWTHFVRVSLSNFPPITNVSY